LQGSEGFDEIYERKPRTPLHRSLTITREGLTLGRGTVLARMTQGASCELAIGGEEERILALLAAAFGKSVPAQVIKNLRCASEQWSRGDKCIAHIHLAFADLPQVDEDAAMRLALADEALAKGVSPRALLKALDLDGTPLDALKFNPDQPRVPAGNGQESGRWTSDENASDAGGPLLTGESDGSGPLQAGRSAAAGGGRREDEPDRELEEERRLLGTETEQEQIEHKHPIDPLETPIAPLAGPPSRSVLIGNNARSGSADRTNSDLPGGLDEAKALFESLTKGQGARTFVTRDGVTITQADDGTQLRIMPDGSVRVERPINIGRKRREIIHFEPR
jgi:hypothetical protein